jgi:NAD(P)-dependent dehydrogenase (short-subunit alcohol dehydrogenase family)
MFPDYSVAKAGLRMLVKEVATELGPHGIRVNAVSPGTIDTWSDRLPDPAEQLARSAAVVPLGRVGRPDDVAKAIELLADPEVSGYITGADLKVDGGLDQYNWLHHLEGSTDTH